MSATPRPASPVLSLVRRREEAEPAELQPAPLPADRYTVLLLDEAQLDRLLHRQSLRSPGVEDNASAVLISSPTHAPAAAPGIRVPPWAARAAALTAAALLIVAVAWWALGATQPAGVPEDTAVVVPAPVEDPAPVVSTGASLSVDVAATAIDDQARLASRRLADAGWPTFTWRVDPDRRHVLVGPDASIDEAEATQDL